MKRITEPDALISRTELNNCLIFCLNLIQLSLLPSLYNSDSIFEFADPKTIVGRKCISL